MKKEEYNVGVQMNISEHAWEDKKYYKKLKHYNEKLHLKFENLSYDWSNTYFINETSNIKVTCNLHGEFEATPKDLLNKKSSGCKKCVKQARLDKTNFIHNNKTYTPETFLDEAKALNSHKFNYDKTKFLGFNYSMAVYCHKHGYMVVKNPRTHLTFKASCMACKAESGRLTNQQWLQKAKDVHGTLYDYSKSTYISSRKPITIICPKHGEFTLNRASDHTLGRSGCNICNKGGFRTDVPGTLYYLSVNGGTAYKIGITNKTVQERFGSDMKYIKILATWHYESGRDALDRETEILNSFKEYKYTGDHLLQTGNSELFNRDILNLDTVV